MKSIYPIALPVFIVSSICACLSCADVQTVEEQDQKKYLLGPPRVPQMPAKAPELKDALDTDLTASVTQGVDSNPLLDSTHKADSYTQEAVDMHFKYQLPDNELGSAGLRFGANAFNVNYYRITDVNIFDGVADLYMDQDLCKDVKASAGYIFETMWYPHNRQGNYLGNSFIVSFKHKVTGWLYERVAYRTEYRNYLDRKIMMNNLTQGSDLRQDIRNTVRYELGIYLGKKMKFTTINDFYINESNYQYMDYYDYWSDTVRLSLIAILTKKLYGTAGFSYQRRSYYSRQVSDSEAYQRDNVYTAGGSFIYDITKSLSAFVSYSHSEDHTNEPLERYVDTLYSGGMTYSF